MSDQDPGGWWGRAGKQPFREWFPFKLVTLIVVFFLIALAYGPLNLINETRTEQTGFRSTGMVQIYEEEAYQAALATVDAYPEDEGPYEVPEDADLAGDFYENVQVLGHVSVDNFNRLMNAITLWVSPEQGCAYCHGEEGNFASDDLYTKVVSRRMIQMTQKINADWKDHVAPPHVEQAAGVNCWTCHRGMNVPQYIWFEVPEDEERLLGWDNMQNHPNPRAASSSLPVNIYEEFLVEDREIRVIPQGPRTNTWPEQGVKDTEWTFSLMVHMSQSLGVNCAYCHNTRSMGQWDQGPYARVTAWYGVRMLRELNNEYLMPLQPVYPAHRLGVTGDAPKANCTTCHQGVYKPLFGKDMISNWPELAEPSPESPLRQAMAK